jgi:non-heme chloroperoxidase
LLKTPDNPEGVDGPIFDSIIENLKKDRLAFLAQFLLNFYNVDALGGSRISDEAVRYSWQVAAGASAKGTVDCVTAWLTDFRADLARIDVPTLVIHGDSDRIVPLEASGARTGRLVAGAKTVVVPGAPHGLNWTHADELNAALLDFLKA